MILHLSGEVNYEMFNTIVKSFNSLKEDDRLYIYFSSPEGGMLDVAEALIDFVNRNQELIDILFYGENFSSGMYIFLKTECHKTILKDTRGMFHFAWQDMSISEGGKPSADYDIFSLKEMKKAKEQTINYLRTTKLSDKEINGIKKGKDIYFSHDRMKELL